MRQVPLQAPRSGPYLRTAAMKYSEQLGWNRQTAGKMGRMQTWYRRTPAIKNVEKNDVTKVSGWKLTTRLSPDSAF